MATRIPSLLRRASAAWLGALALLGGTASMARSGELIGLDHYAITVADLQRAADWYDRVLGFKVLRKWNTTWMVGRGNVKVGLFLNPTARAPAKVEDLRVIQHVAFLVDGDKLDDFVSELKRLDVRVEGPEDTGIACSAFFRDSEGNELEITSYHRIAPPPKDGGAAPSQCD